MKVKFLGESDPLELIQGKIYDVIFVEKEWYRIIDETGDDYLYPPECFEVVESNDGTVPILDYSPSEFEREKRIRDMGLSDA